jgi:spore coat-associated protein N
MRAAATIVSSLVMAFAAIGLAVAAPGRDASAPQASLSAATGAVSIANSREGHAILGAGNLRPGQTVSGTVEIGNDGDVPGRFTVAATNVADAPHGLLSQRLVIALSDVTDARAPRQIFAGTAAALGRYEVGTLAAGASRRFLVTATLPNGGAGDNAYQGSSLSMGLEWHAAAASVPVPTATPTPNPKATPTPTPTATPTPPRVRVSIADLLGLPPASRCVKSSRMKFKLKSPPGTRLTSAVVSAGGKKLRLKGSKLRKPITLRGLRTTVKLKVTARAKNRRTYKASRTYKACSR